MRAFLVLYVLCTGLTVLINGCTPATGGPTVSRTESNGGGGGSGSGGGNGGGGGMR
jgi:hypothetical protein